MSLCGWILPYPRQPWERPHHWPCSRGGRCPPASQRPPGPLLSPGDRKLGTQCPGIRHSTLSSDIHGISSKKIPVRIYKKIMFLFVACWWMAIVIPSWRIHWQKFAQERFSRPPSLQWRGHYRRSSSAAFSTWISFLPGTHVPLTVTRAHLWQTDGCCHTPGGHYPLVPPCPMVSAALHDLHMYNVSCYPEASVASFWRRCSLSSLFPRIFIWHFKYFGFNMFPHSDVRL